MGRLQVLAAVTALFIMTPSLARAQARSGDKEVLVAGNFTSLAIKTGSLGTLNSSNGQFLFGVGYFATDRIEIGVRPLINVSSTTTPGQPAQPEVRFGNTVIVQGRPATPSKTNVDVDGGVATSLQFFFGDTSSTVKPYVGGQMNVNSFKTDPGGTFSDNLFTQILFGVKNYISDRTALDFSSAYGFRPSAASEFRLLTVQVGLTFLF